MTSVLTTVALAVAVVAINIIAVRREWRPQRLKEK
jgi:hypothetical protein